MLTDTPKTSGEAAGSTKTARPRAAETIGSMGERSREIFRTIVDAYLETGEPIGSRTLSKRLGMTLSPATIRNVMSDLGDMGLLHAPHTSAGRLPTEEGLRLFVNGLLEIGDVAETERQSIQAMCQAVGRTYPEVLEEATTAISGLSQCAGLVVAPKRDMPLKHIEFVPLSPGRALVVLVTQDDLVENRVIETPVGLPSANLVIAANFLNARVAGMTLVEAIDDISTELERQRSELDDLTAKVVSEGLAVYSADRDRTGGTLIVKGQSRLLTDVQAGADLERIRELFDQLETKDAMLRLLNSAGQGEGVQVFIGSENSLFTHAGCSLVIAPFRDGQEHIVGAIGVLGPTRLNYARIVPMVDYTAKVLGHLLWTSEDEQTLR